MKQLLLLATFYLFSLNIFTQSLDWVNTAGSSNGEWIEDACLDSSGNVYSIGFFRDTLRFNNSSNTLVSRGDYDLFILKNDANGNYISCLQVGGYHEEFPRAIKYDESGYIYIIGELSDSVYISDGNSSQLIFVDTNYNYARSGFLFKFDLNQTIQWSQFFKSDFRLNLNDIALDDSSNVFVVGSFEDSLRFDNSNSNYNLYSTNYFSGFLSKFDNTGRVINAVAIEGTQNVFTTEIEISDNSIVISGHFRDTMDADPTAGTFFFNELLGNDIYITSLGLDFTFNWAKQIASTTGIYRQSLVEKDGFFYMGGAFLDTTYFDSNNLNSYKTTNGQWDCYILRFDNSGIINWVKHFGDSLYDFVYGIDINSSNKIFITGIYESSVDFNPDSGVYIMNTFQNSRDIFIAEFDTNGTFNWSKSIGGIGQDVGINIISSDNDTYLMGQFENSVDFSLDSNQVFRNSFGIGDAFILKINLNSITSIQELISREINSDLFLFPNPSINYLNIQGDLSEIESFGIYDLNGRLVSKRFNKSQIDISSLPDGVYFLNSHYKGGARNSIKFIKTK